MLDSLRFVQGAVARKDFVPALTHFKIGNGRITGFNGNIALSCPIDLDLNVNPKATQLVKAIQTCQDTIQLNMTPAGRLSVKSGKFRALVDCIAEEFPMVAPEGAILAVNSGLRGILKKLEPFIAEDASRPWARGILLRGQSAFATNNIVVVEHWIGAEPFPAEVNIPRSAVVELLRIGEDPTHIQVASKSVTFHFSGERWLRTQLYSTEWPDLTRILNQPSNPVEIPETLWQAATAAKPFVNDLGRLLIKDGAVSTGLGEDAGATVEVPELAGYDVCFNVEQLLLLENVATRIDLTLYPKPCLFFGEGLRGAIVGMKA